MENPELMFDNVLKCSQPEAATQSRMKDGQWADPRDRIEDRKHLKKTWSRKAFRAESQVKYQPGIWRKRKNYSV